MRYDRFVRRFALLTLTLLAGCRGTVPELYQPPEAGIASVLIGCRMTLPTGETPNGFLALNLEGADGGETYRLPIIPQRALLYQVEPGLYRLMPTLSIFGFRQEKLKVVIEGRAYSVPFPRDILRLPILTIKPKKVVALGVVDVTLTTRKPGQPVMVKVRLDDSVEARRQLVQTEIRTMMDPYVPAEERSSSVAWTRALEETLSEVVTESQRGPAFRAVP